MEFNNTTDLNGIIQECEMHVFGGDYGAISGNTNLLKRFTALCNKGLDKVVSKILSSDTRWQWDDNNNVDYPIATTNLTAGQKEYRMSVSHLKILAVEVKNSAGNWVRLRPLDQTDVQRDGIAMEEFMSTDGCPEYYDPMGDSLFLYPAPASGSVTLTSGLKIYYQRGASYFVPTDTTKVAGFVSIYHYLIPLYASIDYAKANLMHDLVAQLEKDIMIGEQELQDFFSRRDKDDKPRLKVRKHNYK